MAYWSSRSAGYKLGILLLFLASAMFVIGFGSPYWLFINSLSGSSFQGLWLTCFSSSRGRISYSRTSCVSTITGYGMGDWFKVVQAFQAIAMIGVIVSCIYAFVHNCCQSAPTFNRFLEIIVFASGGLGFVGAMVFAGKMVAGYGASLLSWGFGVDVAACILLVLSAVLLLCTNKPMDPQAQANASTMVTYSGGPPQGQAYTPQAYPLPPQGQASPPQAYPPPPQGYSGGGQPGYVIQLPPQQPGYSSAYYQAPAGYSAACYHEGYGSQAQADPVLSK